MTTDNKPPQAKPSQAAPPSGKPPRSRKKIIEMTLDEVKEETGAMLEKHKELFEKLKDA